METKGEKGKRSGECAQKVSAAKCLHFQFHLQLGDNVRGSQNTGLRLHVVPSLWVHLKPGGSEKRTPIAQALAWFPQMLSVVP